MKRQFYFAVAFLCLSFHGIANNVQVQNLVYDAQANTLNLDVSWENGFVVPGVGNTMAYVFIKYRNSNDPNWQHLYLNSSSILAYSPGYCISAAERNQVTPGVYLGFSVGPGCSNINLTFTGSSNVTIDLAGLFVPVNPSFKAFGIEIIRIDQLTTSYSIGDGVSANRFHKGDDPSAPFQYISSPYISVGTNADDINTTSVTPLPVSSIPFYYFDPQQHIMRYEISQAQYVDFLNCLSRQAQNQRTAADISGTSVTKRYVMSNTSTMVNRNGIKCDAVLPSGGPITFYCDQNGNDIPNEMTDGQNVSANYLSPADLKAYLDWAGFKPMNEAQYEYYTRGTVSAVPGEYAWGTSMKTAASLNGALLTHGGPQETPTNIGSEGVFRRSPDPMRTGAAANETTSRSQAGASYWGAMDLSGNVAEMVIGSYEASDFAPYDYQQLDRGDGVLSILGESNESWPAKLVTKGYAPNNSVLHTVSQRHPGSNPYIGPNERLGYAGGRGVFDF